MALKIPPVQDIIERDTLLEFPCRFPLKAMGRNDPGFQALVEKIILSHAEIYAEEAVTASPSGAGNYLAVTVTIKAQSKAQLDLIYQALTDCGQVLVAL